MKRDTTSLVGAVQKRTEVEPKLTDVTGSCTMLGVSKETLYRLIKSGDVKSFRIGKGRRVLISSIEDYISREASREFTAGNCPTAARMAQGRA